MTTDEKLNHTYWELAFALGWIEPGQKIVEADLNEVLKEATEIIWQYKDLSR